MNNTDLGNWQCKILTKSMALLVTGSWVDFLYQSWFYFYGVGLKYKQTVLGSHGNIRVTIHNNTWSSVWLTHFGVMHVHPPEFKGFVTLAYSSIPCKSIAVLTIIFFKVLKQTQRVLDLFSFMWQVKTLNLLQTYKERQNKWNEQKKPISNIFVNVHLTYSIKLCWISHLGILKYKNSRNFSVNVFSISVSYLWKQI